jgi:hypothetical protein
MLTTLSNSLGCIEVLEPVDAGRLQLFGLRWANPAPLEYVTLDEALETGCFEVTEVSEGGCVPALMAWNKLDRRVLVMAGEQLVGAKQNRVLNVSILIEAQTQLEVPVSCVEAGRWGYRSKQFHSTGSASHGHLRAMMSRQVSGAYRATGTPSSDQSEVWREVGRKLSAMGTESPSRELETVYENYSDQLDKVISSAKLPVDCCGVVFAFGGRVAGADMFDKPCTLSQLLPKLVRTYAVDAMEYPETQTTVSREDVEAWLRETREASFERFDSPGLGNDVRIEGRHAVGASLVVEDQPVHVELFPESNEAWPDKPPMDERERRATRAEGPGPEEMPSSQPVVWSEPVKRAGWWRRFWRGG